MRSVSLATNTRQRESLARCTMSILRPWSSGVMIWRCMCVLVSLLVLADSLSVIPEKLLVKTKWGTVRGKISTTMNGRPVMNFLGIPYALPPVGELRFRSPQRWNRIWTTIRDATKDGQKCIQFLRTSVVGSEDCLYLNIFVPYISDERKSKELSVLVLVHGGGFMKGSSDSKLFSPYYLLSYNIILVSMNYRLSALGFFSTANQVSPGNYGIKDIKMALEWIQENIHSFGGNSKSVTLMGFSAGSAATHILALSKTTEGLFHRYILHSGSALSTWSAHPPKRYRQTCLKLAELVGCKLKKDGIIPSNETTIESSNEEDGSANFVYYKVKDDDELMRCMRTIDARILESTIQYLSVWRDHPQCKFGPTLEIESEDAILTMQPWKIVKDGLFRDIPAIFQVVKDEGLLKTLELLTNPDAENELIENFEEDLPFFTEYNQVISNPSIFASEIQDFYFDGNVTLGIRHNITEMVGDGIITWPMFQAVKYQSKIGNSNIYFSFFTYRGTFTHTFKSNAYYGVDHGDDINYLVPMLNNMYETLKLNNTRNDITMINIMTEMWTSFAMTGIPKAWFISVWPNYRDHHEFMRFGINTLPETVVETDFLSNRMEFWENLMLKKLEKSVNELFVYEPQDMIYSTAIDHKLSVQFALLLIIYFYI